LRVIFLRISSTFHSSLQEKGSTTWLKASFWIPRLPREIQQGGQAAFTGMTGRVFPPWLIGSVVWLFIRCHSNSPLDHPLVLSRTGYELLPGGPVPESFNAGNGAKSSNCQQDAEKQKLVTLSDPVRSLP
jgi:hypothetical protein